MTMQRSAQTGSRLADADLGGARLGVGREQFDRRFDRPVERAISSTAIGAWSEDDARLALILWRKVNR